MEKIQKIKDLLNQAEIFVETNNFFYETHECEIKKEPTKIKLDFTIKENNSDEIVVFGICKYCNTLFYHKDFESKR